MFHFYDPLDPKNYQVPDMYPVSDDSHQDDAPGCVQNLIAMTTVFLLLLLILLFTSCRTKQSSLIERHRIEDMMSRMDSVIGIRQVVQHDSTWRELVLRQFQSIREQSDTSHTLVVDTAGRVIKETIVINNVRETVSESDRQQHEVLMRQLLVMDSTITVMREHVQHSDSLLQQRQTIVERKVEKPLTFWQQARLHLANLVLVALAAAAAVWAYRKRAWIRKCFS